MAEQTITVRPATAADMRALYPEGHACSVRALAVEMDGRPVGVGGVYYAGGKAILFCRVLPELRRRPRRVVEAARRVLREIARDVPCLALCDPEEPGAPRFLAYLGLERIGRTPEGEVYQCRPR